MASEPVRIGRATLYQGDCLEVMQAIPDGSIDMALTDPPYGTTSCKWDSVIPFEPMWEQLKRVTKKNGAIVMTASQPFTSTLVMSNVEMFRYELIWDKKNCTGFLNAKKMPLRAHESLLVFYSKLPTYNPQISFGNRIPGIKNHSCSNTLVYGRHDKSLPYKNDGSRFPTGIIRGINGVVNNSKSKVDHPTQKPVALMEYLIKTYTNEGETVLDFTMGSGTTGVAAVQLGREFVGIELEPRYFDIARRRIDAAQRQSDLFAEGAA